MILLTFMFSGSPLANAEHKPLKRYELSSLNGGEGTVSDETSQAFSLPAANLPVEKLRTFTFGNRLFNTNWVVAPSSTRKFDGLGPTFNRISCSACHKFDGRGRPPETTEDAMESMLIRLSIPGQTPEGGPNPHPVYGDQLNDRSIPGVPAEGRVVIVYGEVTGQFADGEKYSLRRPRYIFKDLHFGPLDADVMSSPRVAPAVFGLGLLEAVAEKTVLQRADEKDADGDGISGRPNYVWNIEKGKKVLGRFGWKANQPTLKQQAAGAFVGDIGITTEIFPEQNCPAGQEECRKQPNGGNPEVSKEFLEKLNFYLSTLAVPAGRDADDPDVLKGAELFGKIQCDACHIPTLTTGTHDITQLSHQTIHPYTDMLLHDMGEGLADHRPDFEATGREWRTPPLWGIGLVKTVNKHTYFLHDGRARNIEEAILWHGGEAEESTRKFKQLSKEERQQLLKFLNSL